MSRQGERRNRTMENVKTFWNNEAKEWGDNPRVTIRDHYFRLLEMEVIMDLIKNRKRVLDMGCGSGFSSIFYSQVVDEVIGVDYAELMIERAQRFISEKLYFNQVMNDYAIDITIPALRNNIRFEVGNILDVQYHEENFDAIIAERVLINLPSRELQANAVREIAKVMRPGGLWPLVEVTEQGHHHIDEVRALFGLPALEKYWHNLYVDESHIETVAKECKFSIREIRRFETYQFLSKVIHPLVVSPKEPEFLAGFNRAVRLISRKYPGYSNVMKIGLDDFFKTEFRTLLALHDSDKLPAYDQLIPKIISLNPDFSMCSHQVLFIMDFMA